MKIISHAINKKVLVWCAYFAILLCCSLPKGPLTPIDVVGFNTTGATSLSRMAKLSDLINLYGAGDAGTYATMATHLAEGKFTDYEYWRLRLFAPGNVIIESICLRLFGADFPIAFFFTLITCAFWASVFFNVRSLGNYLQRPVWCFCVPLFICLLGLFEKYLLNRGIVLSESLSAAQLCLGFLYTLRSVREQRWQYAIAGGVFLALAAYMRAQNELVCLALSLVGIAGISGVCAWHTVMRALNKRSDNFYTFLKQFPALISILIALTVFNALTIPYRCWNLYEYKSASWLQWDHYWEANWRDENLMRSRDHDDALIESGETVAARVNPELAASIQKEVNAKGPFAFPDDYYKKNSIITFLTHPLRWIVLKYPAARKAWKDGSTDFQIAGVPPNLYIESFFYLMTLAFCIIRFVFVSLLVKRLSKEELWNFLFFSALLGANALTTIFIHLEARYFYTLKIVSVVLLLSFVLSYQRKKDLTIA